MKSLFRKRRSARYARERMKLLLVSERIECSPQMMKMMRNDLIHSVKKYVTIDEDGVVLRISKNPAVLYATIPVRKIKE